MIVKPAFAAMLASGLIAPEVPKLVFPKPAIVKRENLEFWTPLLGMPLTMGMLAPSKVPLDIVYTDSVVSATNAASYTFTSRGIGTAASSRIVVVGVGSRSTAAFNVTGVTIGGTAATLIVRTTGDDDCAAIYALAVASGTTATIVVTTSITAVRLGIGVWAMYNINSTTAYNTTSSTNGSGTISCSVPSRGGAISIMYDATGTDKTTSNSQITDNFSLLISDNNNGRLYGASGDGTTAGTATFSISAEADNAGCIASWAT